MKRINIMSEYELSYQELRGLEKHFRKIQGDAVAHKLKNTPDITVNIVRRMITQLKKMDKQSPQQSSKRTRKRYLDTETMRWV